MSKYQRIAMDIKQRILTSQYPAGTLLPNQKELMAHFDVSHMTLQKALEVLTRDGLITTHQGARARVKQNVTTLAKFNLASEQYVGMSALLGKQGNVTSRVLRFEVRLATEIEQQTLILNQGDAVYEIQRVRYLNGQSLALERTIMPVTLIPNLTASIVGGSIYQYLQQTLKLTLGSAYRTISAAKPNGLDQTYLDCAIDDPVLNVEQVVFLQSGIPFELSTTRYRYDRSEITIKHEGHPAY